MLPAALPGPDDPVCQIHRAYVDAIKPDLAEKAWVFYQQYGHGLFVLDLRCVDLDDLAGGAPVTTYYVSRPLAPRLGLCWSVALDQALQDYDPARELLVVVLHPTSPHFFRLNRLEGSA